MHDGPTRPIASRRAGWTEWTTLHGGLMKKYLAVFGSLVLAAGLVAFGGADSATVIRSDGCGVTDANGVTYFDADCRIQIVVNKNGFLVNAKGQLPDGAATPDQALHRSITDLGYIGCFVIGDRGETVLTPSGNFNVSCHPAD